MSSLPIGAEFTLPNGRIVEVLEKTRLQPNLVQGEWDSRDTVMEAESFGPITIDSLRALLANVVGETSIDNEVIEDLVSLLLAEESVEHGITDGVRRSLITKMGLRDQPILDQFQDEIFRLPLDKRLLILGPPGTGKTTTLIRRLGQKLDNNALEKEEQRLVEVVASAQNLAHSSSWLMFTPTELLKQYIKEAFAREEVPASDLRIQTWEEYRRELARNVFGILRVGSSGGTFVFSKQLDNLNEVAIADPIQWFNDFDVWQREIYVQELYDAVIHLSDSEIPEALDLGNRFEEILLQAAEGDLVSMFSSFAPEVAKVQALVNNLKASSDKIINGALNLQLNRDRTFIDDLGRWLDGLPSVPVHDVDEPDDHVEDEEDTASAPRTGRAAVANTYIQAVRAHARAGAVKRTLSKTSRNGKIIEWLGNRGLTEAERAEVGASLLVQTHARRFLNPVKLYFSGIPKRYRAFRRDRQPKNSWYSPEVAETAAIHPLELDIVLLAILRTANTLISSPSIRRFIDTHPAWSSLKPILERYRNQVFVDEATDFSPIQLASMASLAHPQLRSFFACGDFNQRLTTWGARSTEDLKWVFPDFDIKEVSVTYRQSKQLNELARAIIKAIGGTVQNVSLPAHADDVSVAPALLEYASDTQTVIDWLAECIHKIEHFIGKLPSIAVFVNSRDEVTRVANELNEALENLNIQVVACHDGQAVGQASSVRVFDIQYIKGLEFEAVFFIGIDQLAALHPSLFDKYLYVGATRAATYLGVTCQGCLPPAIESLRSHFCESWQ